MSPTDKVLCERVCESIDNVQVNVENGKVHLYGKVDSEEARKNIEAKARSIAGVDKVESHLKVKNK